MASVKEFEYETKDGKTVKRWKVTVTLKGCPRVSKTFDRKTDADEWTLKTEYEYKHQRVFGHAHHKHKTLAEALQRYLDAIKLANPQRYKSVAPLLTWWSDRIGTTKMGDLSSDIILRQRDRLKAMHVRNNPKLPKLSNARVNRYVAALSCALNVAMNEWDWITKNPLNSIKMLPEPTGRTRFLQPDELDKLLLAAKSSDNKDMYAIIMLALTTGARRGEIEKVRLRDVNLHQQTILLTITKNKKPRVLYLVEPAYSLIKAICSRPELTKESYIFASPVEPSRPNSFRRAWKTTSKRAELKDFRFHDLRHTAASLLAQHGAGLHQISEILGHSSFQVTKRYIHLIRKDTAAIIESTAAKVFNHDQRLLVEGRKLQLPSGQDVEELAEGVGVGVYKA